MPWTAWNLGPSYSISSQTITQVDVYYIDLFSSRILRSSLYSSVAKTHLKSLTLSRKKRHVSYTKYPADTHAEPLLILLDLDALSNRREEHFLKLIKSFIAGKCHPAMKSFVSPQLDKSLVIQSSRTSLGRRRPGVVGTTTDLVSVLTQRTHNPLYVTGTRS